MTCVYRVWRTPLSAYVRCLWVADGYVQPHAREFVLPTGSLSLVIDLDVEGSDAIRVCGARSEPLVLGTSKPLRIMAAVFKPGGGFPFAACPAGELIEMFRREVGLPPKVFARLARFGRVLQRLDTAADVDWADLAISTGYFDQPHFIGDFRQFAGVTPSAYLRHRTARNHVRIAD